MKIKYIHYGLTLLYSYYLPLFNIVETSQGFIFEKVFGVAKGLKCMFKEYELLAECNIPSHVSRNNVVKLLGLNKSSFFADICRIINMEKCVSSNITLVNGDEDAKYVFYAIYLSRNTDYYVNTIKWTKQAITDGYIDSSSYIAREFNEVKESIDKVFNNLNRPEELIIDLLSIRGVSVKSVTALMLHSYGLTNYAPIDRHYANYLRSRLKQPVKNTCIKLKLNCEVCPRDCIYKYTLKKHGVYNGVLQSLVYIYDRLRLKKRSEVEKILVKDPSIYLDKIEDLLIHARSMNIGSIDNKLGVI
ncbi:MAG: hypothetical protein QXJ64_10300 [Thermosphaera sp.]